MVTVATITGGTITGADIFSFSSGSDKITLVGFRLHERGQPGSGDVVGRFVRGDGDDRDSANTGNNLVEVFLNGAGSNNYAKITVNGVTTLNLTDFEFS